MSPKITVNSKNEDVIKHTINLILELFGKCEVLSDNLILREGLQKQRIIHFKSRENKIKTLLA